MNKTRFTPLSSLSFPKLSIFHPLFLSSDPNTRPFIQNISFFHLSQHLHALPLCCAVPLSCSEGFTELGYYNGTVSQTDSGAPCLKWTEFPDYVMQYPGRGLGDHNYCRNPDRESNPWCFFRQNSGAIGWAYCDCHQGMTTDVQDTYRTIPNNSKNALIGEGKHDLKQQLKGLMASCYHAKVACWESSL